MSMCRVFFCVVERGCFLWPVSSLGKTLLAFVMLHFVLQGQICLLLKCFLTSCFCIPVPYSEKHIFFWVLVLKGLVGLHRTFKFSFFSITGLDIDLDYHDVEWFALEVNRDHSVVFEITSKYCILDSFVDYHGHSISSKGFLPTVVDIMVIWVKSTHSSPS